MHLYLKKILEAKYPSSWEAEGGGSGPQGQPGLGGEFKISPEYTLRLFPKSKTINQTVNPSIRYSLRENFQNVTISQPGLLISWINSLLGVGSALCTIGSHAISLASLPTRHQ